MRTEAEILAIIHRHYEFHLKLEKDYRTWGEDHYSEGVAVTTLWSLLQELEK